MKLDYLGEAVKGCPRSRFLGSWATCEALDSGISHCTTSTSRIFNPITLESGAAVLPITGKGGLC